MIYNGGRRTRNSPFGVREKNRVVCPKTMQERAISLCHDAPLAGHMGIRRTWRRIVDSFWWKGMKEDVTDYVKGCESCGRNKHSTRKGTAPLQKTDIPAEPLDKIQVDFLGPFGVSTAHDYRYALQIQDILSRYVMLIPTVDNTMATAANTVFDEWVCKFSFPAKIQSDQGRHFAGQVFQEMCKLNGIEHQMGAVGHAQSQGQVERQNQLVNQVRSLCANNIDTWPQALVRVQFAHNVAINQTTQLSPHHVLFGQDPKTPESVVLKDHEITVGYQKRLLTDFSCQFL